MLSSCGDLVENEPSTIPLTGGEQFEDIIDATDNLFKFISLSETNIKTNPDMAKFEDVVSKTKNDDDLIRALNIITNEPEEILNLIKIQYYFFKIFRNSNPEFLNMSEEERYSKVRQAIDKRFDDNSFPPYGNWCSVQYNRTLEGCHANALAGSVACGLLSPTLFGALLCAGVVIVANEYCHYNADTSYAACNAER